MHFLTVEIENLTLFRVYKTQKAGNSLTVSQKINKFWGPGNFFKTFFFWLLLSGFP